MGLFRIKDARESASGARVIADLDALIAEPVAFRFQGKTHLIKPISTAEFLKFLEASTKIGEVISNKESKPDDIVGAYYKIVSSVCDSFTLQEVKALTEAQAWALFRVIVETVKGKTYGDPEKKKMSQNPT